MQAYQLSHNLIAENFWRLDQLTENGTSWDLNTVADPLNSGQVFMSIAGLRLDRSQLIRNLPICGGYWHK